MVWMGPGNVSHNLEKDIIVKNNYILIKDLQKLQDIVKLMYMILNWGNWIYVTVKHGSDGTQFPHETGL